jgi:hypothetical protein
MLRAVFGVAFLALVSACSGTGAGAAGSGATAQAANTEAGSGPMSDASGTTGTAGDANTPDAFASPSDSGSCRPDQYLHNGTCLCSVQGAFDHMDGKGCTCQLNIPDTCPGAGADGGAIMICVDKSSDPNNCGACQNRCAPNVGCVHGTCGVQPSVFVQPTPGCTSLKLAYQPTNTTLYWADLGHSTIASIATSAGGMVTTLASATAGSVAAPIDPVPDTAGNVYWINTGTNSIGVRPAGGVPRVLVTGSSIASVAMADPNAPGGVDPLIDGGLGLMGGIPIIGAIALSPDEKTLYIAAGTRFYAVAAPAGGTPAYIGYTNGPEFGIAHALAADATRLFYATDLDGNVQALTFAPTWCDPAAAKAKMCPLRIGHGGGLLLDTIYLRNGVVYWVSNSDVVSHPLNASAPSVAVIAASTATNSNSITSFALGATAIYLAEVDETVAMSGSLEKTQAGFSNGLAAGILVRNIPQGSPDANANPIGMPNSIALDGTNVYYTQGDCSIMKLVDPRQ